MKIANWVEKNPIRVRMKGEELKWSMRTKLCFLFQSVKGHGSNYVGQRLYHRHSPAQAQTICLFVDLNLNIQNRVNLSQEIYSIQILLTTKFNQGKSFLCS